VDEPLENLYFNWLCAKVIQLENPTPSLKYDKLLKTLHDTEYVWLIPGDDDRAEDGVELRWNFLQESGLKTLSVWEILPCSMLEMLVAFSKRAEFATDVSHVEWFWEFIQNLGLSDFNDAAESYDPIPEILYTFIWRQYDYAGNGGLFPIEHSVHDQRETEVWYQFCDYLVDQNRMP
jgi:hypothetical protein